MRAEVIALFAASGLVLVPLAVAAPAEGAVSAGAPYSASTRVESTPNQTLKYAITLTRRWDVLAARVAAAALRGHVGPVDSCQQHPRGQAGKRQRWFRPPRQGAVRHLRRSTALGNDQRHADTPASTAAVTVTALSTGNAVRARGTTPALTFTRVRPCPSGWPRTYVTAENRLAGTTAWRLASTAYDSKVAAGFVSQTSAACGDVGTFRVTSSDDQVGVSIYRMGYYGETGARLVWASQTAIRGLPSPRWRS
jgi:hypothetical protein